MACFCLLPQQYSDDRPGSRTEHRPPWLLSIRVLTVASPRGCNPLIKQKPNVMRALPLFATLLCFALTGFFVSCEVEREYEDWDADGNELLDENEFATAYAEEGIFTDWDGNADGYLDADEWGEGADEYDLDEEAYSMFDVNMDNQIDDNEFRNGLYTVLDGDGDGGLSEDEWEEFDD